MNLLDIFMTLEASPIGEAIRNSLWLFPVIEAFHLVGFAFLGGCVVIVDLRLVGVCLLQLLILGQNVRTWPSASIHVPCSKSDHTERQHSDYRGGIYWSTLIFSLVYSGGRWPVDRILKLERLKNSLFTTKSD